ncbi:OprD family outer membrane porin [Zophobihabitans entericus]|uniref:OprD family porin n=1 Tax=Zophobihabitans entericus TaxID=1635327 RepID=A0A6G9ICY2_9GAMM|nr:OprD family outer membrane porin [Zophobihabitans entericus]QIQ21682.1 OprD family porin [Zophobihabitans entericus]
MKKLVVLGMLSTSMVFSAYAAENQHYEFLDTLAEESLIKDSHMDLTLRNYWKYLKEDEAQPKEVHNAWGQAFGLDFKSGYFADFIGFDATFTGVVKLGASDYFSTRALLYNDGSGMDKDNAKGFSKIGQRYIKIKLGNETVQFNGKVGWQILKNYGVLTASNRLSQNSYLGYSGTLKYDNFSFDAAYITSSINRDSPDKVSFTTNDKYDVDYIWTGGLTYKDKDLYASYSYGEADDYMRRHVLEMTYKPISKLTLGSQIYGSYALDRYDSMAAGRKDFDDNAWHYAADIKWKEEDWSLKFGVAYTDADKEGAIGYYNRHLTKNMRGRFNALTSAGVDYMRDGELALTVLGEYEFIPDVTTGLQLNYGQFDYKGNTVRSGEINLINRWAPSDTRLKNLSIFSMFGYGWSYKQSNKTPVLDHNGDYQRSPSLSAEIIIDYRFNLF